MLKLSPPPFPTRFDSDEQAAIGADQDQNSNEIEAVAWPTEHNGHGVNSGQSEIKAGTKFNVIRNEREQYIDSLGQCVSVLQTIHVSADSNLYMSQSVNWPNFMNEAPRPTRIRVMAQRNELQSMCS